MLLERITHRATSLTVGVGLAAALVFGAVVPAFAAGDSGVVVTAGSLSGGTMAFTDFATVPATGVQQTTTATWTIGNIVDSTGSGAGWKNSMTLTPLAEWVGAAYIAGGKTLATSSLKVSTATLPSVVDGTSSPANTITPTTNTTALDTGFPVTLLSAAAAGGMGSYSFSPMIVTLTLPANVYAITYRTNATISTTTGP
jgi:hypothetical protein